MARGAGKLCGPCRPASVSPPDAVPDMGASGMKGGIAQSSGTPITLHRNFQMRDGGPPLLPSPRSWGRPVESTSSSGNFGLLEAFETGRRNMNKALDEISDVGTRRALRSVLDEELGRLSIAISKELAEKAVLARELASRNSGGGGGISRCGRPQNVSSI